ncbi:YegP family protein, partial [Acinetobacter tandoii]
MSGWFELSQANDGQYRFVLKAGNGEVILTSELYKAKASVHVGIESVHKNSADDSRY